jgi:hypothetical protein
LLSALAIAIGSLANGGVLQADEFVNDTVAWYEIALLGYCGGTAVTAGFSGRSIISAIGQTLQL